MQILITGDLHLTSNPKYSYRFDFLDNILSELRSGVYDAIIIAGDLTDKKDRHPARLVDRVVRWLVQFANLAPVYIVTGNHDFATPNVSFFEHLNRFKDPNVPIKVIHNCEFITFGTNRTVFISNSYEYSGIDSESILFTKQNVVSGIRYDSFDTAVMHHDFYGAIFEGNYRLDKGISPKTFNSKRVISGHIHRPQILGPVIYVGSPFPVRYDYGDITYRMLSWDTEKDKLEDVVVSSIRRRIVNCYIDQRNEIEKLLLDFNAGDAIKFRVTVSNSALSEVPSFFRFVSGLAKSKKLSEFDVDVVVSKVLEKRKTVEISNESYDEGKLFSKYCNSVELDKVYVEYGRNLL